MAKKPTNQNVKNTQRSHITLSRLNINVPDKELIQSIKIFDDLTLLIVTLQSATQQAQSVKGTSSERLIEDVRSTFHAQWLRAPLHTLVFISLHHKMFACLDEKQENVFAVV